MRGEGEVGKNSVSTRQRSLVVRGGAFHLRGWLFKLPDRLRERDFWLIQSAILLVTGVHLLAEAPWLTQLTGILSTFPHHIPVILYSFPIAYASIRYGWEGGVLAGGWVVLLTLPNIWFWHREHYMWVGEILVVLVIITVGLTLAYRVQVEARLRRHAEAVSTRLSASESRFRALFETAGDAIVVLDRQGFIVSANSAASSLLGTPAPQNLLSQHIGSWILSWQDFPQVCRESQVNGPARVSIKRSDGRELTAEVVLTALPRGIEKEGFQAVLRDATVREMREKGLRSLVHQIIQAQEEERERIARELHDDFLQTLILLTRELESIADIPGMPEEGKTRLARMASLAGSSGENLRSFSRDLRPSILNDLGLVPAIDWLMKDLAKRANLDAHFRVEGLNRRLSHYIELALFRIAQEALRNVEKHAHATRVEATLSFKPSLVTLTISDNGLGFSPPSTFEELVPRGKLGLVGLKERVSLLGGTIQLSSAPGKGTRLSVEILG